MVSATYFGIKKYRLPYQTYHIPIRKTRLIFASQMKPEICDISSDPQVISLPENLGYVVLIKQIKRPDRTVIHYKIKLLTYFI